MQKLLGTRNAGNSAAPRPHRLNIPLACFRHPKATHQSKADPSAQDDQLARLKRLHQPPSAQPKIWDVTGLDIDQPPSAQPPRRGVGGTRALAHSIYIYIWFTYGLPMIYHNLPMIYLWFTDGLPMIYLWFTYGWFMIYLWFTYDWPMVDLWFTNGLPWFHYLKFIYDLCMNGLWFIWHICNLEWPPGFQNFYHRHLEWLGFVGMLSVWNLQKYT